MRKMYLDYLRVIAIAAVIILHVTSNFYSKFDTLDQTIWWLSNFLNTASRFAVPLFVMISGAVLLGKSMSVSSFYSKRASRLIPPMIFWTMIFLCFKLYQGMSIESLIWTLKVGLFAYGHASIHLWYLSMFICLMLFVPFINQFIIGEKPNFKDLSILTFIIFLFFIANSISGVAKEVYKIDIFWFKVFPWFIGYFILGYYLDKCSQYIKLKNSTIIVSIISLVIIGAGLNYYSASQLEIIKDSFLLGNKGAITFLISLLIFLLAKKNEGFFSKRKIVSSLSNSSFGIYLIHPIFIYVIQINSPEYYSNGMIYIPATVLLTFVFSHVSITLLRKNKLFRKVC